MQNIMNCSVWLHLQNDFQYKSERTDVQPGLKYPCYSNLTSIPYKKMLGKQQ